MRRLLLAFVLLGCGHPGRGPAVVGSGPEPGKPAAASDQPKVGEYVVVSSAATFHSGADQAFPSFHAQVEPAKSDPTEDASQGLVLRVLSVRPGWVELDNPTAAELTGHCRGALPGMEPFLLHFFVRTVSLAHVVTHRYTEAYPDGTQIDLLPGLPLGPPDAQGHSPSLRPLVRFTLALPPGGAGMSYAAPSAEMLGGFKVPAEPEGDAPVLVKDAQLTVGPHAVVMRDSIMVRAKPVASGSLVELSDECSRVTALAKPADIGAFGLGGPAMEPGIGIRGGGVSDQDTRYLYPKTALFWADGRPAGEVREPRSYDLWRKHPTKPDLACIVHDLTTPDDTLSPNEPGDDSPPHALTATQVTLCFRYADSNYRQP